MEKDRGIRRGLSGELFVRVRGKGERERERKRNK